MSIEEYSDRLPYLTSDVEGIGGRLKVHPEDFYVEEVGRYELSGEGTHVYGFIEKRLMATVDALERIARALKVRRHQIGYAGRKDTRAVTRQWISIEHIDPEALAGLEVPGIKVLEVTRHGNKLKVGHLAANKFAIRLREFDGEATEAADRTQAIMEIMVRRGVPNYFGPQRFGQRGDSALLGWMIIRDAPEQFMDLYLGMPIAGDRSVTLVARGLYEQGDYQRAHDAWPGSFPDHRRLLRALVKNGGNKAKAYKILSKDIKRFFVSAFQSDVFNQIVAGRMPGIDKILEGDVAYLHRNGACFHVEDAIAEQPRCERFEISPTGPLMGKRMTEVTGPAGEVENRILAEVELESSEFEKLNYYYSQGGRRPLRFQPRNVKVECGIDEHSKFVQVDFELDSGCYATTVLREIMKNEW